MTHKNVENFQTSLNLQQTYSAALGSHINNIYHKILEIQQQLPHPTQHMNTGDVIQIDAPDFNPDIDGGLPTKEHEETQGLDSFIQQFSGESEKSKAPALPQQVAEEVDWPDAVPVEIPPQLDQDNDHNIRVSPTPQETNFSEIPQLESDIDEEEEGQFEDLQTYLTHHNTYQESQNIHKEYRKSGGPLSSIDSVLSRRLCKCCDSSVAVAGACGITGVTFATMSAAFFQLDAFIVINAPLYKYKVTNAQ